MSDCSGVGYRADVDGLRAVSILLVVAYHGGLPWFGGGYVGVDIFFVISGFLITGLLVDEVERSGMVALRSFFTRRIRRLLPLASLVLVTTVLVGFWLLPPTRRVDFIADARSAALYFSNWRFAGQATAYSDVDVADGLLVHYWSLSIEEQFYLCWPVLVALCAGLVRRFRGWSIRTVLGSVVGLLILGSATASVLMTHRLGSGAYFLTWLRIWELGIGAGLAIAVPRLPGMSATVRGLVALAGIVAIGFAATAFNAATAFPGIAAALPVVGTAAVLASGVNGSGVVNRFLGVSPLTYIGRLSYAWYLWHWPAIGVAVLLDRRWNGGSASGLVTAIAVAVSLGLAAVSHVLVENPIRASRRLRRKPWSTVVVGVGLTVFPILVGFVVVARADVGDSPILVVPEYRLGSSTPAGGSGEIAVASVTVAGVPAEPRRAEESTEVAVSPVTLANFPSDPGGAEASDEVLGEASSTSVVDLPAPSVGTEAPRREDGLGVTQATLGTEVPEQHQKVVVGMSPRQAAVDEVVIAGGCHQTWFGVDADPGCVFGDPSAATHVVLVGDSHALQWLPAFEVLGRTEGWAVHVWTKSSCPILDAPVHNRVLERRYDECNHWRGSVMDAIAAISEVHLVVMGRSQGYRVFVIDEADGILSPSAIGPAWSAAASRTFAALGGLADHTVLLVDTPWSSFDIPDCLAENSGDPAACDFGREAGRRDGPLLEHERGAAEAEGVSIVDPVPLVCPDDPCRAVTGEGIITYRDSHHLTATYARSLAGGLGDLLAAALR